MTYRARPPAGRGPIRVASEEPIAPAKRAKRARLGPGKTDWLVMLVVILPALAFWILLGFFSALVAGSLFLLGLAVGTIGMKRMMTAFKARDLHDFYSAAPWYMRSGWLAVFTHFYHTWHMPRTLGLWLFMECLGTLLLMISVAICTGVEPPLYPGWRPPSVNPRPNAPQTQAPPQPEAPRVTGDARVDRALLDLGNKDGRVRSQAAELLWVLPPNEAHRAVVARKLAEVTLGPEEVGRGAAARALAEWACPEVVPDLLRCLLQAGPLREAAGKGLRRVGPAAEKDILAFVADTGADSGARGEAITVLRDIGTPASLPTLQGIVDRHEPFLDTQARTAVFAIKKRKGR